MKKVSVSLFLVLFFSLMFACSKGEGSKGSDELPVAIKKGSEYRIVIVMDTVDDWSSGIRDGFRDTMNSILEKYGATAVYDIYDTELDEKKAAGILEKIKALSPDLICAINYPTVFADQFISSKLTDPKYKIVSENCIPVESGIISSWERPGGNITGVGVFVQMNSPMRLLKKIDPKRNKLVFISWDVANILNKWFKEEISRAAEEENIELIEFREVKNQEETFQLFRKYNNRKDVFFMGGISAFVHEDGSDASDKDEVTYFTKNIKLLQMAYEETPVQYGLIGGACVIWNDIGAQLAEKAERVLNGETPGEIPWDYPRKFNLVLNKKRADEMGIKLPQEILSAAYRIYTDYEGNFIGQGK